MTWKAYKYEWLRMDINTVVGPNYFISRLPRITVLVYLLTIAHWLQEETQINKYKNDITDHHKYRVLKSTILCYAAKTDVFKKMYFLLT